MIDRVEISPPTDDEPGPRIELIGHLTALLRTAGVDGIPMIKNAKSPPELTDGLVLFLRSQSGDAGTGLHRRKSGLSRLVDTAQASLCNCE